MQLLLDESLPRPLAGLLQGHDVKTVTQMAWTSLKNGDLLRQAATEFESLEPLVPEVLKILSTLQSKTLVRVGA